jgi:hypothetical protein
VVEREAARSASLLLAFTGLVLLGLCILTAVRRQDVLAGGLAVLGLGAMVLAALTPRLTGPMEIGLSGFKMELVKLSEVGRLAGYSDEEILAAIESRFSTQSTVPSSSEPPLLLPSSDAIPSSSRVKPADMSDDEPVDDSILEWNDGTVTADHDGGGFPNDRANLPVDLNAAIKDAHTTLAETNPSSPCYSTALRSLGNLLFERARLEGKPDDLETSLAVLRKALTSAPRYSSVYTQLLKDLATALRFRSYFSGATADQEEIITLLEQLEAARRREVT